MASALSICIVLQFAFKAWFSVLRAPYHPVSFCIVGCDILDDYSETGYMTQTLKGHHDEVLLEYQKLTWTTPSDLGSTCWSEYILFIVLIIQNNIKKTLISGASRGKAEYQGILWHWICRVWNAVNPLRSSEEIQTHDSHDTWLLYKAISYQSMWLHSSLDSACIMHYHVTNWDAATFQSLVCCHLQG